MSQLPATPVSRPRRSYARTTAAAIGALALSASCAAGTDRSSPEASVPPVPAPTASESARTPLEADLARTPGAESAPSPDERWSRDDVEYKLASIDHGRLLDLDDPVIGDYADVLESTEKKCEQDRDELGDISVRSVQLLDERGVSVTSLELLEVVDDSIPDELPEEETALDCREIAAILIVLIGE